MDDETYLYLFTDRHDRLLYMGITGDEETRYRRHTTAEWWRYVTMHETVACANRAEAASAEKKLIQRLRPPFNEQHNPDYERLRDAYKQIADPDYVYVPPVMCPEFLARVERRVRQTHDGLIAAQMQRFATSFEARA